LVAACGSTDLGEQRDGAATNGTIDLHYIVNLPEGDPPFPAVVIGQGSGDVRVDAGPTVKDTRELLDLGFAVIRYSKRGTGDSGGEVVGVGTANSQSTVPLLASDIVAEQLAAVGFVVINSGGVLPVGHQVHFEQLTRIEDRPVAEAEALVADYEGPIGFDPRPLLRSLAIPTLYLWGDADRGITLAPNDAQHRDLQAEGVDLTLIRYPEATHLLEEANSWPDIADWLSTRR
jgi:hypothetical protein